MLPVNVAVHDIELGERSQHGVRTAGMAVVGRAGDGSFHAEILLQIPAHVPIELTFRIRVESYFGGVAFLGGGGGLLSLEARDGRAFGNPSEFPELLQLFGAAILPQPEVEDAGELFIVVGSGGAKTEIEGVLVEEFHDGDGALIAVFGAGVRVDVGQQVPGVFLLKSDEARIEKRESLAPLDLVKVLHAVAGLIRASHVQVEIDIDSVLLEFGDLIIQPVELPGVEGAAVVAGGIDNPARRRQVEEVQPHHVDAVAGQGSRVKPSVFMGRKQNRTAAPIGDVDTPEADALAAGFDEVAALNTDEAIFAGGRIEQKGHIGGRGFPPAAIPPKKLLQDVIPLREGGGGEEQEQQRPLGKSPPQASLHGQNWNRATSGPLREPLMPRDCRPPVWGDAK